MVARRVFSLFAGEEIAVLRSQSSILAAAKVGFAYDVSGIGFRVRQGASRCSQVIKATVFLPGANKYPSLR